jgi:mannose-P-dolichol utilization defect protein 1
MDVNQLVPLVSAALSYGILVGSAMLKVPQIIAILRARSVQGLSLEANLVELFGYLISASWGIAQGLAVKDYGEVLPIIIQAIVILLMMGHFGGRMPVVVTGLVGLLSMGGALALGTIVPVEIHQALLGAGVLVTLGSRGPQILLNLRNRSTGTLSFISCFLAFGGSAARVLTTAVQVPWEKGKAMLLVQFAVAAAANFILVAQILYYKRKPVTKAATAPAAAATKSVARSSVAAPVQSKKEQ